jgi:hypothetical protein
MHNIIIKKFCLFQIIPTKPKINKIKEKFKHIIKGIKKVTLILKKILMNNSI